MLASGIGAGFGDSRTSKLAKICLRFRDWPLPRRHIDMLKRCGIEEPHRDLIVTSGREKFRFEDVTRFPGIEIDYAVDIERANAEFLPGLNASTRHASRNAVTDSATGRLPNHE